MTETQKRIKAYQAELPGLKERVAAVALLLVMSMAMMTSATFAWITISRSPELSGVTTNLASNGNLEIALASGNGKTPPGESQVGDSSAAEGQTIFNSNLTWGNLINLSDPAYGLDHLVLRPAQLNTTDLLTKPLYGAVYETDGRIKNLTSNYGYTAWVPEEGNVPAHFGLSTDVGVRAVSSIKREQTGFAGDYLDKYEAAFTANSIASGTFTALTQKPEWLDVLAELLGIHMTATLNWEEEYKDAKVEDPATIQGMVEMYEAFVLAHRQEADAIARMINLQLFAAYGGNTEKYNDCTAEDILNINPNGGGRIQSNGDYSYNVNIDKPDGSIEVKTIKITDLKTFLKDYNLLVADLAKLKEIQASGDWRWTTSGLSKIVANLMNVDTCKIKLANEPDREYQTIADLMKTFTGGYAQMMAAASKWNNKNVKIQITNGVLFNLEKRVGSTVKISDMKLEAIMDVGGSPLPASLTAEVVTSAPKPSDYQNDLDYTNTLNTGADTSSGQAVAEDTYALAVDFWVRTNAVDSLLTLEGNVLLGEAYTVPVMTQDDEGNEVQLHTLVRIFNDEQTGEMTPIMVDVYKKEENGVVTWYRVDNHKALTEEELGDAEPTPKVEERRDVIGYEGENRVWDKESKEYLSVDSTTQGVGSCYVYYADSPEDQARSLELLKSLTVAFVDSEGSLLAQAAMDTENCYGESGRFIVPLKVLENSLSYTRLNSVDQEITAYGITTLQQNVATRITAIVYLDGRELGNDNVLSAADIQGQLNIQFGNTAIMKPIDNEKLESETRTVTASLDVNEFNFDTHQGPMKTTVTIKVDGSQPKNVSAFFIRKINSTQGSREKEMVFQPNGSNFTYTHTFTEPGEYVLRSVYLDGVEYVLKDPPEVVIKGFNLSYLTCSDMDSNRHIEKMTAQSSYPVALALKFLSDDASKMPTTVQGRFLRDSDGIAVNINFVLDQTTQEWKGSASFLNSGTYTLQYLVLNGKHTELQKSFWITANIKLGMKVRVYTTDITKFKFTEDEMVATGTDKLQMQVEIVDNGNNPLSGKSGVKLFYRLDKSAETIDADLTWNPVTRKYEGELQALLAGPGNWIFYKVTDSEGSTIMTADIYPTFEMQSPEPPSYVDIGSGNGSTLYRPAGNAVMSVKLKYSGTATVAAVFKDNSGRRYPVLGTAGTTENNETLWNFTVPGGSNNKQDGHWTLETVYLWNYYKADGTYVEWEKDETGKLKGALALNPDGTLAPNDYRNDESMMVVDIKTANGGAEYKHKVVQTVTVDFTSGPNSTNFGKTGNTVDGVFMQSYDINTLQVKITDFEGKSIASDLKMTITYKNNTSQSYGGYTNNDLENSAIVYESVLAPNADGTVFTQATPIKLYYAGQYTTTFSFKLNGVTASLSNDGVTVLGSIPQFTVSSVHPKLVIDSVIPGHNETYNTLNREGSTSSVKTTLDLTTNKITVFPDVAVTSGCSPSMTVNRQAQVKLRLDNMGNASGAFLEFGIVDDSADSVYLYTPEGVQDNGFGWTSGSALSTRNVGYYQSGGCSSISGAKNVGEIKSNDYVTLNFNMDGTTISVKVAIAPITIYQDL